MMEVLLFLAAPFAMCLVLLGIHCYLGLHVLARGVVFVDLSLAQVASCGTALALLMGWERHSSAAYAFALGSTLLAAFFFTYSRRYEKQLPQEALIGIVYAFTSAAILLLLDHSPHGAEELKSSLTGQILLVSWADVYKTALIYLGIAALHFVFRHQLLASSFANAPSWLSDLIFYASFAVVITSSTQVGGVLLVFSFLIAPAVLGNFLFKNFKTKVIFGWTFGALMSAGGLLLSYVFDAPAGAFIVALITLIPILLLLFIRLIKPLSFVDRKL